MLVMEYLEGKSLRNQYRDKHLSYYEVATVLHQGLLALEYLHGRSPPVTHRDVSSFSIVIAQTVLRRDLKLTLYERKGLLFVCLPI